MSAVSESSFPELLLSARVSYLCDAIEAQAPHSRRIRCSQGLASWGSIVGLLRSVLDLWCSVGKSEVQGRVRTMAWVANALISLMALGARFLKVTPCSCSTHVCQRISHFLNPSRCLRAAFDLVRWGKRTRLCMWMVYSRATTSAMAERLVLPVFLVDDISAI